MGQRGADRDPATAEEIAEMGRIAAQGVEAGGLGFTTSRTLNHRTSRGEPTPTLTAAREELVGIAAAIGETGKGVLQVVTDFPDFSTEIETLFEMMRASGRPLSVSVAQGAPGTGYRRVLAAISAANAEGLEMRAQVAARGIGILIGLDASVNPWRRCETYRALDALPMNERVARLSAADTRGRILAEYNERPPALRLDRVFELTDPPDYEPQAVDSVAARAERLGVAPEALMYDLLLANDGAALLYSPILNYFDGNLDAAGELLAHSHSVPGLGDGGAHVGTICDASFTTTLLSYWGRDRTAGARFELPWLVQRQCRATAEAVGLRDRGLLAPGYRADINVIDFDRLGMRPPTIVHDLPAGGRRLVQSASGYQHTFVNGVETYADGEATGELPGRLVRGARPDPMGVSR
jgi:N-acyl-D-aspartate/D-glutamate deacylase